MRYLYKIIAVVSVFPFMILMSCEGGGGGTSVSPIFSNVDAIGTSWDGSSFSYYLPDEVEFAILSVFREPIETSGNTITNEDDFLAGSRTSLEGWTRSSISADDLYTYDPSLRDFTNNKYTLSAGATYYWAVWGFDEYMNLTHASGCTEITIEEPASEEKFYD